MHAIVGDLMKLSPVYVYENDNLFKVIEYMKKFNVDAISVINKDNDLSGHLSKQHIRDYLKSTPFDLEDLTNSLKKIIVKDVMKKDALPLTFYPTTRAEDALSLMKCMNNKCAPVVEAPWEKKVVGFIWLSENRC